MEDWVFLTGAVLAPWVLGAAVWRFMRGVPSGGAMRLIAINALVLAFLLSVVFVPLEAYYRFFADSSDGLNLTRVSERWFRRHYRFNNAGFRDDIDYQYAIAPGKRRLTFLGDSVTVGHGIAEVSDRFANQVRRAMGENWEVHVLAGNGVDTGAEIEFMRSMEYQLDVLALVYSLNDVIDMIPEWDRVIERIYREDVPRQPAWLRASVFADAWYWHLKAQFDPDLRGYPDLLENSYTSDAWDAQRTRLLALRDLCRAKGATLVVFTVPQFDLVGADYRYRPAHDRLDRMWRDAGVPHRDLTPIFAGHAASELVVSRWDNHPNNAAHRMIADAMVASIEAWVGGAGANAQDRRSPRLTPRRRRPRRRARDRGTRRSQRRTCSRTPACA